MSSCDLCIAPPTTLPSNATHHPYPHPTPHPQSLWQRGLPQLGDDFVRCICDCHGNSVVAMGTEIHKSIQCVIAHCMELGYLRKLQHVSPDSCSRPCSCQVTGLFHVDLMLMHRGSFLKPDCSLRAFLKKNRNRDKPKQSPQTAEQCKNK